MIGHLHHGIRRWALAASAATAALGLAAGNAPAGIVGVSGQGVVMVPNATPNTGATANFFNDGGQAPPVRGWNERQNVVLDRNVVVDAVAAGTYDQFSDLGSFTILAGTAVSSHLLYFDPAGSASAVATFNFDAPILGVILESDRPNDDRFLKTDFLGNPLTVYPNAHFNNRGLEWDTDAAVINVGLTSVTVRLTASSPGDQVRVITAVPEPSTFAMAGLGLVGIAGAAGLRRRAVARLG